MAKSKHLWSNAIRVLMDGAAVVKVQLDKLFFI